MDTGGSCSWQREREMDRSVGQHWTSCAGTWVDGRLRTLSLGRGTVIRC